MTPVPRPGEHPPEISNTPTVPLPHGRPSADLPGRSYLPLPYAGVEAPAPITPPLPRTGIHGSLPPPHSTFRPRDHPLPPSGPGRRSPWKRRLVAIALIGTLVVLLLGGLAMHRMSDFGLAISQQAPFSTQTNFMSGSGRINLLVLGYGGVGHDGAYLTDSMILISLIPSDHATTVISVPRDLWVQVPPNSGQYAKINTAYQDGFYNGYNGLPAGQNAGGTEAAEKVGEVVGLPVNYWLTMNFDGFRSLVDSLGGVEINVPVAFTAQYPVNDDPAINANWKIIHFNTGPQHMDGEQAIEYARARYVLSPLSQGTDFARSVRQQQLISAILARARQVSAWPSLLNATNALQNAIYTNLSLTDLALFSEKLDLSHAGHVGLTNQNVLVSAQSSDGQDILLPINGDWGTIASYVNSNLKS